MEWGIERGYDAYELGSTSPDLTDGSFVFKDELGADIRPVLAWERGNLCRRWFAYRAGRWVVRNRSSLERYYDQASSRLRLPFRT